MVWGSTYLAIRIAVLHLPPAAMAGLRHVVAGTILLVFVRGTRRPLPARRADWVRLVVSGVLLLGFGNGLVVFAERDVASGIASILGVTVSLWIALFDAVLPGRRYRPSGQQVAGLLLGFGGTLLLAGRDATSLRVAHWGGMAMLTAASASWALGSVYLQRLPPAVGPYASSAVQMLAGGIALLLFATVRGEWSTLQWSLPGMAALAYLILFGSLIGFTAYLYVLRHLPATIAGTYAYANTVVAVFLGWAILGEPLTARALAAMTIVIGSVLWVRWAGGRR